ncbi:hypothetical protein HII31_12007 [Pseudocercospora fuligena]|uniref:Uncharacterized protein n=1 Tax=Pseudocercospora fuligena TaxID=685502 RepID=A0A8H6VBX1_9PEZI|nr:hypothetical protein HII31_12007 [Pseudocercospora fuligena]
MATTAADSRERHRASNIFATARGNAPVKRIFAPGKKYQVAPTSAIPAAQEPKTTQDSLFDGSLPSSWTFSQDTQTVSREEYEEKQRLRDEKKAEQERELERSPSPPAPDQTRSLPAAEQPRIFPSSLRSDLLPSSTLSQQYLERALRSNEKRDLEDPDYQETQQENVTPPRKYVTRSRTSGLSVENVSLGDIMDEDEDSTPARRRSPASRKATNTVQDTMDEIQDSSGPDEIPAKRRSPGVRSPQVAKRPRGRPRKAIPNVQRKSPQRQKRNTPVLEPQNNGFVGFGMEIDESTDSGSGADGEDLISHNRNRNPSPPQVPQAVMVPQPPNNSNLPVPGPSRTTLPTKI